MDTIWFSFVQILGIMGDVSVSKLLGFETFPFFGWFRIRYRKNLVSKKYRIRYRKKFGIGKKFRIRFRSDFGYRHTLVVVLACVMVSSHSSLSYGIYQFYDIIVLACVKV